MEKQPDPQTGTESKTRLVQQVNTCLRSGDYPRALELLRGAAAEFPNDNDAELSKLEKLAHDGVKRNAEANRLITESQELFAQRKSAEAIQLLRQAHELDKNNSLARAILANALVEHAQSVVETDWLEAETLTNQALALNPAHPTAKTVHGLIVERKTTSSVDDWVARAGKLQSSGDLFAALAWVAEGLAVHPDDPKLLQIHEAIQRDQAARRRQARRGDVEDLRRMQREIDGATDVAAKQALAERIQAMAAKYWTDGEILSIANALLLRLGLVSQESSSPSPRGKGATVILHVPRPAAPQASPEATQQIPASQTSPSEVLPGKVPEKPAPLQNVPAVPVLPREDAQREAPPSEAPPSAVPPSEVPPRKVPPSVAPPSLVLTTPPKPEITPQQASTVVTVEPSEPSAKVASPSSRPVPTAGSSSRALIFVSAAAIVLIAATFFLTRKHYAPPVEKTSSPAPIVSAPDVSTPAPATPAPATPAPATPAPATSAQGEATQTISEPSPPASSAAPDAVVGKVAPADHPHEGRSRDIQPPVRPLKAQPAAESGHTAQPQNPQPQPRLASLTIQGGTPGTTVLVDQALVGTIQADGTLSISTVNPGEHIVELRKERFKSRQFKRHFVAGGAMLLAAADAVLEGDPGVLTITFTPADATIAIVKGDLLKMVSSGVPLNLSSGTYTLTARTAERFTRTSTLEVMPGQSKTLTLSLAPNGMSKWDDPGAWKHEKDSFTRKGGDFVLYGVVPPSGTFVFSAMPAKGRLLQWVLNYSDSRNYVLFQMDDNNFYRSVIRNGQKTDEIKVPDKGDKNSLRTLQISVSATEVVHQVRHGDRWTVLDRWTQPGANLSQGKFGFYLPGNDQVTLSSFAHYVELNLR